MDHFLHEFGSDDPEQLRRRIEVLEDQISTYERLLEDLPDLFERKFQQRLDLLMERYRLLERRPNTEPNINEPFTPALPPGQSSSTQTQPDQVIRPGRWPWRWPRRSA